MITSILELLKESDLIKFFSIVGTAFLFFAIIGRVWGIKEPLSKISRGLLFTISGLMLIGALIGYSEKKNSLISEYFISQEAELTPKGELSIDEEVQTSIKQKIGGKKNKAIGNVTGDKNQIVQGNKNRTVGNVGDNSKVAQGNNNDLSTGKSEIINSSYRTGDYIVHYRYNITTGDTLSKRKERIEQKKPNLPSGLPEDELGSPTGDVKFGNNCNLVKNSWVISDGRGIINFFNPSGNKVGFSGEFRPSGLHELYDGDFIEGNAIVYSNDKIVLNGKGDYGNFTAILRNLERCYLSGELTFTKTKKKHSIVMF